MWDLVIDGKLVDTQPRPTRLPNISNPTDETLNAAGWFERFETGDIPEGHAQTGTAWVEVFDNRSVWVRTSAPIPEPIPPVPDRFPVGVDTPLLVLDAPDGKGIGYVADGEGGLVPIIYAHESPYDMDALQNKVAQARADHAATRQARVDAARSAAAAAGGANSVAALRAQVQALAAIVEALA